MREVGKEGAASETTVCAVVVTYNRADLLARCLDHLAAQTRPPDHVVVVDNHSTDGVTPQLLAGRDGVEVLTLDRNLGSSGGFAHGIGHAFEAGYDWLWALDDDTLADPRCLEELLAGAARAPRPPSLMASTVRWTDGRLHPMNHPWLRASDRTAFAEAAGCGLALIRTSTFVSAMFHRDAVQAHGLPPAHYFVWLDDMEYSGRILRDGHGYLVPESIAWHATKLPYNTLTDARERFYYKARNHLWLLRGDSFEGLDRAIYTKAYLRSIGIYLRDSDDRPSAVATALKGIRDGLRRPR